MNNDQQNNLITQILDRYNKFDSWLSEMNLGIDDFTRNPRYAKYKEDAHFLRNLRNLVAHNSVQYVSVLKAAMKRIDDFVSEITSNSLVPIMIPLEKLYVATMTDKVLPAMQILRKYNYSYLPIINDDTYICKEVFSSYILMSYLCTGKTIDESTTFEEVYSALDKVSLKNTYKFLPIDSPIIQAIDTFKVTKEFHMDVVLVTEDGKKNSPLLGMITVWDFK